MTANSFFSNGKMAWARVMIYIASTMIALGISYGKTSERITSICDQGTEGRIVLAKRIDSLAIVVEKSNDTKRDESVQVMAQLREMNTRLSRIEGALGVRSAETTSKAP